MGGNSSKKKPRGQESNKGEPVTRKYAHSNATKKSSLRGPHSASSSIFSASGASGIFGTGDGGSALGVDAKESKTLQSGVEAAGSSSKAADKNATHGIDGPDASGARRDSKIDSQSRASINSVRTVRDQDEERQVGGVGKCSDGSLLSRAIVEEITEEGGGKGGLARSGSTKIVHVAIDSVPKGSQETLDSGGSG